MNDQKAKANSNSLRNEKEDIKKLREELEKVKSEASEYKNKYLRALADYQNYENRLQDERLRIEQRAINQLILKLLPFIDNLEKAEVFFKDPGLKMIKDNFYKMLSELGLKEINLVGKEFDPHLAEAVEVVKGDKDNMVTEVIRKGYILNDIILRVAQVKVSKKVTN